ncbi:hypothetical protein J7T55_009025 [Diaporthe amygdali]|uniref:uncharacterized protein n=1 Tax=Phomopsis amygdali TaxID=1214568 RepID=UPI0022FEF944|nr:uncharacterized protein J7T55_009025 [Diaporthe amygdali]KAJ0118242.1 hypothetical protein J7T55_009025 [Diaporthe amygdali]
MSPRHKNRKGCSQCGHCCTWRADKAFRRTTKAFGSEFKKFKVCNRCSRKYRKEPLSKEDFMNQYGGADHSEYATTKTPNRLRKISSTEWLANQNKSPSSDPDDDDEDDEDDDEPKNDGNGDQGGGSAQGGMGHAVSVA